ncbi:MAG TPA: TonB-dependent receptor [Blastocatellia bacterium]|nr:TonB-dependent receptor [Blastocatellia bacterium]
MKVDFSGFAQARALVLALLTVLSLVGQMSAQSIATRVNGTVKDASGAAVVGAKVTLIDKGTGRQLTTSTNQEGFFVFPDARAGMYSVTVEQAGFKKIEVTDIQANVDMAATVNVTLEVGQVAEVVTTTASQDQLVVNNENASLQTTVLERQINDLPLNGRNPLDLAGLQAGVASNGGDYRTASINGLRGTFSNLTWDGVNINDNFIRTDSLFGAAAPSVASVSEFTLTTQNGGPDDGLGVAQLKLVTPRGSTDYHGQLFEFHRNDAFDANTFFNNRDGLPKEKLIQNQFGFNLGGPIKLPKKIFGPLGMDSQKLFFYTYYEGTRIAQGATRNRRVLTPSAKQGLFTYRAADGSTQTVNLLALSGRAVDPRIQTLLNLTPAPNNLTIGDGVNYTGFSFNSPAPESDTLFGFRTDYEYSERHRFEANFSRYSLNFPNDTFNDIGSQFPGLLGGGQASVRPRGSFAWNWTPTATLNNEFRVGFFKQNPNFFSDEKFALGYRLTLPNDSAGAAIATNPVQNFLPQGRNVTTYEFIDNASWAKGNHNIRFGGNFRRVLVQPFNFGNTLPTYTLGFNAANNPNPLNRNLFPGSVTQPNGTVTPGISANAFTNATAILALLTGSVTSGAQTFNVTSRDSGFVKGSGSIRNINYYAIGGYGSDTWRLKDNLTLTLGLRYEFISVPTEANGLALLPKGGLDALTDPNAILDFAGSGTSRAFYKNDFNNFAPTISIAWDPFRDGKTSIRAGYSISYAIDNNVTTVQNAAIASNAGLSSAVNLINLSGTVTNGGLVSIPTPAFKVPRPITDNLAITQTPTLFTIDPNLRTPYVQQWTLGVSREIMRDTAVEVRYVGNHGVKLTRGIDTNQVTIFSNGFYDDFLRAQRNLNANGDPRTGETLQVFPRLGLGGSLGDANVINLIAQGQVGELANMYTAARRTYLTPGANSSSLSPGFFLPANPNAYVTDYVGNYSYSNYHALQIEMRRRLRSGIYFQTNYTYGRNFTDFDGAQTNFSGLLDLNAGIALEKRRSSQDITHIFKANAVYELPFGKNKRFLNGGGALNKVVGGIEISPIVGLQSGRPISILSALGTRNRTGRSGRNTVVTDLSLSQLKQKTGIFYDADGNPVVFDPSLIDSLNNPAAGQFGNLQQTPVSGPRFFNTDIAVIKRTSLSERIKSEFRAEFFNAFNTVNFNVGEDQNINSPAFGQINDTYDPRILQFSFKLIF